MSTTDRRTRALIFMRIVISLIIAIHGVSRLIHGHVPDLAQGIGRTGMADGLALMLAWIVTVSEAFVAPLYALGFFLFPLSVFYAFVYTVGIFVHHLRAGWFASGSDDDGCEFPVLLVIAFLCVAYQNLPDRFAVRFLPFGRRA